MESKQDSKSSRLGLLSDGQYNEIAEDNSTLLELVANCDRFNMLKHSSANPFAFTEQGVAMLSAILKSDTAVRTSIRIIDAFVAMRNFLMNKRAYLSEDGANRNEAA